MAHTHHLSTTTLEDRQPPQHPPATGSLAGDGTTSTQRALGAPLVTTNTQSSSSPSERARKSWDRTTDREARMEPARRAVKMNAAERYIARLVESAPPLTDEQLDRLAGLLRPTGGAR